MSIESSYRISGVLDTIQKGFPKNLQLNFNELENESEGGASNHGCGIRLMMLTDSDNYCDKIVIELNQKN